MSTKEKGGEGETPRRCAMEKSLIDDEEMFSRGFDAGNYASAYVSEDIDEAWTSYAHAHCLDEARLGLFWAGFIVGFFSSYEDDEIPCEHFDEFDLARAAAEAIGFDID